MLIRHTLVACCGATLLLSFTVQALELHYTAPEVSHSAPSKPQPAPGPAEQKSPPPLVWSQSEETRGWSVESECDHPGCTHKPSKPFYGQPGPVKKTDRLRQSDPYSTDQSPDAKVSLGYQW
jgi:hypothetical protein